jgi:hypothetical protein
MHDGMMPRYWLRKKRQETVAHRRNVNVVKTFIIKLNKGQFTDVRQ